MNRQQISHQRLSRREILKYGLYGSLAAGLSGSLWLGGCRKKPRVKRPRIILITIDTLRADHLGCYGYRRNSSPHIDQFAQDGMLFENCLTHAPATRTSFASILSGFLPHETKIIENHLFLPTEVEILPEILQRQGYKTVAVVSNYVLRRKQGYEQGFMIYDDTMNELEPARRRPERTAVHTTNRAIELLKQFSGEKLFMWIHYQDPHGPYTPPEPFARLFRDPNQKPRNLRLNKSLSGRGGIPAHQRLGANKDYYHYVSQYDGEIRYQDEHFKRLIDTLKRFGFYDNSLIILTSDHGEGMGEHDYYFAHGENLYSDQTHVPLIVKYGNELTGRRPDFVQHLDIIPTILKILGRMPDSRLRGRDLRQQQGTNREIFAEMNSPLVRDGRKFSLVREGFKLIYTPLFKQYELFNMTVDPHEECNLIDNPGYAEQTNDLKTRLHRLCREDFLGLSVVTKPPTLTDEEREKLKSLGYIR